jgi:hypothetical protein
LWLIGIDERTKRYIDICGTIDPADLKAIEDRGFFNTDAGYRINVHEVFNFNKKVDAFLLNTAHFSLDAKKTDPLIVHELAHLLEQLDIAPQMIANDDENAEAILKSLQQNVLKVHTKEWARHLAVGARVMLTKGLTPHSTIREFLEAAVPGYDRDYAIKAKKGW